MSDTFERLALSELMLKRGGSIDPSKYPEKEFVLYSIPACDLDEPEKIKGSEVGSAKKKVQSRDVLLSRIVPHIRRSWIVKQHLNSDIIASGEWIVFRDARFYPAFLRHFLLSDPFHTQFMQTVAGVGGSLLRARPDHVGRIEIPLPPLDEQKRIAAILDKADQLRRKRREAITLLDNLTQSIFLEMFGEVASRAWPTATIGEITLDMRTGPFGSQLLHSEFVDEGIAVLGIDNAVNNHFEWGKARFITEQKYRTLSRYTVKPKDVLITIMGTCGRCAVVPADIPTTINTKHLCCLTLDEEKALPEYLHACFLNHRNVLRQLGVQAKGAVMPGLNMGIIKSLVIPIPPISLQQRFRGVLAVMQGQIERAKSAMGQSDSLFASLQHRAFSGQL